VLFVVSSAVFLSVNSFLVTVEFGSSFQLLSRNFSFRHGGGGDDGGGGGSGSCWKREKEGEECWILHVGTCNGLVLRGACWDPVATRRTCQINWCKERVRIVSEESWCKEERIIYDQRAHSWNA
jgi:hypothetical protein